MNKYILYLLIIIVVILFAPIPYYRGNKNCYPYPCDTLTGKCGTCPKPGWKVEEPIIFQLIGVLAIRQATLR
jgi:hypothetical protein